MYIKRTSVMEHLVLDMRENTFACVLSNFITKNDIKEGYTIIKNLLGIRTVVYHRKVCAFKKQVLKTQLSLERTRCLRPNCPF